MKLSPLSDGVIIEQIKETQTPSGFIIPVTAKDKDLRRGKIIEVGRGRTENGKIVKPEVKKGDEVLFEAYGDAEKLEGKELFFVHEAGIKAIIKK